MNRARAGDRSMRAAISHPKIAIPATSTCLQTGKNENAEKAMRKATASASPRPSRYGLLTEIESIETDAVTQLGLLL